MAKKEISGREYLIKFDKLNLRNGETPKFAYLKFLFLDVNIDMGRT